MIYIGVGIVLVVVGLIQFFKVLWWSGVSRSDLPEGSIVQRLYGLGSNLGCVFAVIFLIVVAGIYLTEFIIPWFQAHFHHGPTGSG